ncbi:hypothetical protein HU200_045434 [Digitaria exilis]|uniref:Uncharacterized protein n=1 Tax=Digitaria exilis TaxID=1010633 RepID=A0A835B3B9_9POAL|nr:hypothetical protein HU200_045434 [Digitaria exilis]
MPSAAGGGELSRSASAVVANTARGYHILRIDAYSRTTEMPTGKCLKSLPFTIGGHRWCIRYYPNGNKPEVKDYISLFFHLDESVDKAVKAQQMFRFIGDVGEQALTLGGPHNYGTYRTWGYPQFIKRQDLVASKHLRDDSFTGRCDVTVISEFRAEEDPKPVATIPAAVPVPSSDLHKHLGYLLETEKGADVVFDVAGQTFAAHRCVLAARSSVFSAELYGVMKEGDTGGVVHIEDMDPRVFKALLYFIYTDLFPETAKEEGDEGQDEDVLCQHLLVAADRYNLERLKLLCENKLCGYIDVGKVTIILALAEQHNCHELKKACLDFLSSPANLKAAVASDGFKHLSRSCPSVLEELIAMLAN